MRSTMAPTAIVGWQMSIISATAQLTNDKRFYRLTGLVGLKAVIRRVRPAYQRSTPEITAENILGRDFTAEKPNEKWLTDVTEMKYGNGEKLYLSAILDLKSQGYSVFRHRKSNNNQLVFDTFR